MASHLLTLEDQGKSGGDKQNAIGQSGQPLVQTPGLIHEAAGQRAKRHYTQPHLIADQDHPAWGRAQSLLQRLEIVLERLLRLWLTLLVMQQIAQPERQAIYD